MRVKHLILTAALSIAACAAVTNRSTAPAKTVSDDDPLWRIVSRCLDPSVRDYCQACNKPLAGSPCVEGRPCANTTEVWEETADYVAMRDMKMCGCPDGFVHGLAMPRARITGIEDPRRPDGIWAFAWNAARQRIGDPRDIALVVNSPRVRSLNQLHVHLLRLRADARAEFTAENSVPVESLADVWHVAAKKAGGGTDYSILVAAADAGGYVVVIDKQKSPEKRFARATCTDSDSALAR